MAAYLMPFFLIMCELFNGVLRPQAQMPVFWANTMYYIGPFTYWIGGILSMVMKGVPVECESSELSSFYSPPNQTCSEYASSWLSSNKGHLANPNDMGTCHYCQYSYGDDVSALFESTKTLLRFILVKKLTVMNLQYLNEQGIPLSMSWQYLGIFAGFTVANYLIVYLLVYVFSVKRLFKRSN